MHLGIKYGNALQVSQFLSIPVVERIVCVCVCVCAFMCGIISKIMFLVSPSPPEMREEE